MPQGRPCLAAFLFAFLSLCPAVTPRAAGASPVVAVPPATLELWNGPSKLAGAPLAERVQLSLQSAPPLADIEFVSRDALNAALREQELALAGASANAGTDAPASSVRAGRLAKADWILRLRLRAENIARPRIEAEVVDALRADLLARADLQLEELPATHWLLTPNEASVARFTELAARALRAAAEREAFLANTRRVAPLVFADRSPHARLAPLTAALHSALRRPRPGEKLHVLGYEAESAARAESGLFLAGLTSAAPADWARVADAYVWGEFTEAVDYNGPVADLPVRAKLMVWSDDRGPRPVEVEGRFGDLPALADKAAEAALGMIGEARISDPFAQRATVAALLRDSARELRPKAPAYSARLLTLADFFDPLGVPENPSEPGNAVVSGMRWRGPDATTPLDPVFAAWRARSQEELLAAADSGPVLCSPWLAPGWRELPVAALVPPAVAALGREQQGPHPLALAAGSLWLAARAPWFDQREKRRPELWRLDLSGVAGGAREMVEFPGLVLSGAAYASDGTLWFSSRGAGLFALDPATEKIVRRVGLPEGLPDADLRPPFSGPGAWFVGSWQEHDGVVSVVPLDRGGVRQTRRPSPVFFPGLPAAASAAIAAHGDESAPRVRLPEAPVFAYEEKPSPVVFRPGMPADKRALYPTIPTSWPNADGQDPRFPRAAVPTGTGDGYWVASEDTVAWAAGHRIVPLAHWMQGRIATLADDGRHLLVVVARRHEMRTLHAAKGEIFTVHLYDYVEGSWRGRFTAPNHRALLIGDGRLLLVPNNNNSPWRLADLASLRPADPPPPLPTEPVAKPRGTSSRINDTLFHAVNQATPDLEKVRSALAAGADSAKVIFDAAWKKQWAAFDLLWPGVTKEALNREEDAPAGTTPPPPLGLRLMDALLRAERTDLARRVADAGARLEFQKSPYIGDSLAWLAVRCGDADLVARLHAAGWPLATDIMQHPLREAARQKNETLLRYLVGVSTKERINSSSGDGQTPLFVAADHGWAEGVRLLLAAGADDFSCDSLTERQLRDVAAPWPEVAVQLNRRPGAADNHLDGARAVAAVLGKDDAALAVLPITPAVTRYRDYWDWTVLHHAARRGRSAFVRRLLAAGAAGDALTTYGESPLCLAVAGGDAATCDALLLAGANVNARRARGWLPLHVAARDARPDLVRRLLAAGADPSLSVGENHDPALVLAAATRDDEESLGLLIAAGAPLDTTDAKGFGPLEAAVISDSPAKIQLLIDRGARWQKPFDADYHPMDAAAKRGLTASIRKLRNLGLQSPRALSFAKDDATRALLQDDESASGRLRLLNEEQWPAVIAERDAVLRRRRVLAHLGAGANPNHLSDKWGTPLDLAIFTQDAELVHLLVANGSDPARKSTGMAAHSFVHPRTSLHLFLASRFGYVSEPPPSPPAMDGFVLEMLPLFWPHEGESDLRGEMLDWAQKGSLLRASAWMRSHLSD